MRQNTKTVDTSYAKIPVCNRCSSYEFSPVQLQKSLNCIDQILSTVLIQKSCTVDAPSGMASACRCAIPQPSCQGLQSAGNHSRWHLMPLGNTVTLAQQKSRHLQTLVKTRLHRKRRLVFPWQAHVIRRLLLACLLRLKWIYSHLPNQKAQHGQTRQQASSDTPFPECIFFCFTRHSAAGMRQPDEPGIGGDGLLKQRHRPHLP